MAIVSMQLDPNAASYSDDEIVGKVNAATDKVSADHVEDGSTNKVFTGTEQTKLTGIAANATIDQTGAEIKTAYETEENAFTDTKDTKLAGVAEGATVDQTGAEVRDLIVALADDARQIIITNPVASEFKVVAIHRQADGKLDIEYDDVAV